MFRGKESCSSAPGSPAPQGFISTSLSLKGSCSLKASTGPGLPQAASQTAGGRVLEELTPPGDPDPSEEDEELLLEPGTRSVEPARGSLSPGLPSAELTLSLRPPQSRQGGKASAAVPRLSPGLALRPRHQVPSDDPWVPLSPCV